MKCMRDYNTRETGNERGAVRIEMASQKVYVYLSLFELTADRSFGSRVEARASGDKGDMKKETIIILLVVTFVGGFVLGAISGIKFYAGEHQGMSAGRAGGGGAATRDR